MNKNDGKQRKTILSIAALLASAAPALAHHPMGGATPATFTQGLLSGFGHPVIGLDHLAFILAAGVLVGSLRLAWAAPVSFVVASAIGVLVCAGGWPIPLVETIVALSLLCAGALLLWGRAVSGALLAAAMAVFGLFHGYAFGEAVVGAEPTPIIAYLAGLAIVQLALIGGVAYGIRAMGVHSGGLVARAAGSVAALAGAALLLAS